MNLSTPRARTVLRTQAQKIITSSTFSNVFFVTLNVHYHIHNSSSQNYTLNPVNTSYAVFTILFNITSVFDLFLPFSFFRRRAPSIIRTLILNYLLCINHPLADLPIFWTIRPLNHTSLRMRDRVTHPHTNIGKSKIFGFDF